MNKYKEREHKFRILFIDYFQNPIIDDYCMMDSLEDEEKQNICFSVDDITEDDKKYLQDFLFKYKQKEEEIKKLISSKLKEWDLNRIAKCEAVLLCLATYEILYDENVDTAVAINEAVELAKKYGEEKSPKFINGVLSDIAKK